MHLQIGFVIHFDFLIEEECLVDPHANPLQSFIYFETHVAFGVDFTGIEKDVHRELRELLGGFEYQELAAVWTSDEYLGKDNF